jgi:hypothetical protein
MRLWKALSTDDWLNHSSVSIRDTHMCGQLRWSTAAPPVAVAWGQFARRNCSFLCISREANPQLGLFSPRSMSCRCSRYAS